MSASKGIRQCFAEFEPFFLIVVYLEAELFAISNIDRGGSRIFWKRGGGVQPLITSFVHDPVRNKGCSSENVKNCLFVVKFSDQKWGLQHPKPSP